MAKAGRGADQYMVRFPRGLRDRVKDAAERGGRSMNDEIIRTLEKEYPEPWDLSVRINHLTSLLGALRRVRGHDAAIDALTVEVLETVEGIAAGQVPDLDPASRERVQAGLNEWFQMRAEEEEDRSHWHERDNGEDLDTEEERK